MRYKGLTFCFALLAFFLIASTGAFAVETHQGKVLSTGSGKLTIMDSTSNKQLTHEVAADADIMCGEKKCGLSEIKAGDLVTVTISDEGEKELITKIEVKTGAAAS